MSEDDKKNKGKKAKAKSLKAVAKQSEPGSPTPAESIKRLIATRARRDNDPKERESGDDKFHAAVRLWEEKQRARVDNVVYAKFGSSRGPTPPDPLAAAEARIRRALGEQLGEEGTRYTSTPGVRAPIADKFFRAIAGLTDRGRVTRGKEYARQDRVLRVTFEADRICGYVKGTQLEPFEVSLELPQRRGEDAVNLAAALSESEALSALRAGRISDGLFRKLVVDPEIEEIECYCSCPDRRVAACKHAVALALVAGEKISDDPNRLVATRGLDLGDIEKLVEAATPLDETELLEPERYWHGKRLPPLPQVEVRPVFDEGSKELLEHALRPVVITRMQAQHAVDELREIYDRLVGRELTRYGERIEQGDAQGEGYRMVEDFGSHIDDHLAFADEDEPADPRQPRFLPSPTRPPRPRIIDAQVERELPAPGTVTPFSRPRSPEADD